MFLETALFLATVLVFSIFFFKNRYRYWESKNVLTIPPKIPFGNSVPSLPKSFTIGLLCKHFYDYLRVRNQKFGGVYLITEPNLVVTDPDLVRDIFCTNFTNFVDRGFYFNEKHDAISANLFTVDGPQWRTLRTKLSSTFTSNKMKTMFQTMVQCSGYMTDFLAKSQGDIDIKEIAGRFATDVIGSCAFGIECNSFKYPDAEFRRMGKKIFTFDFLRSLRALVIINLPKLALKLGLRMNNKDVADFFIKVVEDSLKIRKEKKIQRNDFLQLLIDLEGTINLSFEEITAQVFLFFLAGFETSSTAICFALYELSKNEEIQEKLRQEVCTVLDKHKEFTYEALTEMTYLKQVLDESLRLWPSALTLNRRCTDDYTIPGTDVVVEKGTPLLVSIYGLHMDPEYYPDPDQYNPDRFNAENIKSRHPCVYLPFGDGPRSCIGKRFGTMQSRVAIATIVKNFKISLSPKTGRIVIDQDRFLLSSLNTIYLNLEPISV